MKGTRRILGILLFAVVMYWWGVPYLKLAVNQLQVGVEWVRHSPILGLLTLMLTFMMISMLGIFIMLPGTPPTIGAGFIFGCALGFWKGMPLAVAGVWLGDATGSFVVFWVVRRYLKGAVMKWLNNTKKHDETPDIRSRKQVDALRRRSSGSCDGWVAPASAGHMSPRNKKKGWAATAFRLLKALDRALEEKGVLLACLLRLSPFFPFSSINYLLAVSSIPTFDYLRASPALLPGIMAYVFIGSSISAGTDQCRADHDGNDSHNHHVGIEGLSGGLHVHSESMRYLKFCLVGVSIVASLGALSLISQQAKSNLDKIIEQEENKNKIEGEVQNLL